VAGSTKTKTKKRKAQAAKRKRPGNKPIKARTIISASQLGRIRRKISKEFPEFKDVQPTITEKIIKPRSSLYKKLALGVPKQTRKIFRLKFAKIIQTVDRARIERILMVSLNAQGKIIKITESR